MKRIVAITHSDKASGANPGLTEKGKLQIGVTAGRIPAGLNRVIMGTGKRFGDIWTTIKVLMHLMDIVSVRYSPLLGSADSGTKTETGFDVILADETVVPIGEYQGIIGTPGIDLWAWLASLEDNTLLCTGREFIGALGVKDAKAGAVYTIDVETKTATIVV